MRNTSGTSAMKMMPSSVKISTNATIVACRCTIPERAAYARLVAVTGSLPALMNASRVAENIDRAAGL